LRKERPIYTEDGVSVTAEQLLDDKNSDDEENCNRKDRHEHAEHQDYHGRVVSHRHHHAHLPSSHPHHVSHGSHSGTPHKQGNQSFIQHSDSVHRPHGHGDKHNSMASLNGLWMLIDGIGLAMITAATVLECYELWTHFFHKYWELNTTSLTLWFLGRTCQIIGLMFLIGHASSFQIFHEIEQFGMLMLTIGPIVNMFACCTFSLTSDPDFLFQKQWFSTEAMELFGILILDVSLIDMPEFTVLATELIGFVCLCCAAGLTMEFQPIFHPTPNIAASYVAIVLGADNALNSNSNNNRDASGHRLLPLQASEGHSGTDITELLHSMEMPSAMSLGQSSGSSLGRGVSSWWDWMLWSCPSHVSWRLDTIHMSECCGLILLMLVAYGQYRMKLHKHHAQRDHNPHQQQSPVPLHVDTNDKDHIHLLSQSVSV
jgi:hypothetical protein